VSFVQMESPPRGCGSGLAPGHHSGDIGGPRLGVGFSGPLAGPSEAGCANGRPSLSPPEDRLTGGEPCPLPASPTRPASQTGLLIRRPANGPPIAFESQPPIRGLTDSSRCRGPHDGGAWPRTLRRLSGHGSRVRPWRTRESEAFCASERNLAGVSRTLRGQAPRSRGGTGVSPCDPTFEGWPRSADLLEDLLEGLADLFQAGPVVPLLPLTDGEILRF